MSRYVVLVILAVLLLVSPAQAAYEWRQCDAGEWTLWRDGLQIGNYLVAEGKYYPRTAPGQWDNPCPLPAGVIPPPGVKPKAKPKAFCPCCGDECDCAVKPCGKPGCHCVLSAGKVEADGTVNFGLDVDEIHRGKHILNGKEVTKEKLFEAIGKTDFPDDSKQLALTVIGPEVERKRVTDDLESSPSLAPWKGKVKIQSYDPSDWAVSPGFVTAGQPTIYCQGADGTVLFRQDSYAGPEALATALREADKNYNPQKDHDPLKPLGVHPILLIGGGILLILLLKGKE